jgi:hypothetical protein
MGSHWLCCSLFLFSVPTAPLLAEHNAGFANFQGLPGINELKNFVAAAPGSGGDAGGLFHGTRMWAAVVKP